jgi:hypothetical protein
MLLRKIVTAMVDSPELLKRINFRCYGSFRTKHLFERRFFPTQYSFHSAVPRLPRLGNYLPDLFNFFSMSEGIFKKELLRLIA